MKLGKNVFAVILAGGSGTRFWPKSRLLTPKQLCRIGDAKATMLENTIKRLDDYIPAENRLIVTHQAQAEKTKEVVGSSVAKILKEPEARNTAAALAMAALEIERLNQSSEPAVMISLHADHLIEDEDLFRQALTDGVSVSLKNKLTLVGITPTHPDTGFGYIEKGNSFSDVAVDPKNPCYEVASFREKPHLELATEYVNSENFLWNSGIFIWPTKLILEELKSRVPVIVDLLSGFIEKNGSFLAEKEFSSLEQIYAKLPKIAIDNAVLEVSANVAVLAARFGWKDVGSWDALSEAFATDSSGNLIYGRASLVDSKNITIDSDGPLVGVIGLEDIVVVSSKNAILVCPKNRAQDVKKLVEDLQQRGLKEYL